jgi:hypothetical protein
MQRPISERIGEKKLRKSVKKTASICEAAKSHPAHRITNGDFKDCGKFSTNWRR